MALNGVTNLVTLHFEKRWNLVIVLFERQCSEKHQWKSSVLRRFKAFDEELYFKWYPLQVFFIFIIHQGFLSQTDSQTHHIRILLKISLFSQTVIFCWYDICPHWSEKYHVVFVLFQIYPRGFYFNIKFDGGGHGLMMSSVSAMIRRISDVGIR